MKEIFKARYLIGIAALVGGTAFLWRPQVTGRSKSSQKDIERYTQAHMKAIEEGERLWQPVRAAMASGDLNRTRKEVENFAVRGGDLGFSRVTLGRFYLSKGDLVDAKAELDPVVDPFDPLVKTNMPRRARPLSTTDAEALCLWQEAAVNAPESEKQAVLARWYANYNNYGMKGNALDKYRLTPEALTEDTAGQYCMANKSTYAEAVKHFRRAVALAPTSLEATKDLVLALRFNGDLKDAKIVAVRASQMTNKESERRGILWGAHVSPAEAKKIAAADKP